MEDLPAAQAFCTFLTDFLFSNFIFFTYENMGSLKKIVIHYIQVHGCSGQRYHHQEWSNVETEWRGASRHYRKFKIQMQNQDLCLI